MPMKPWLKIAIPAISLLFFLVVVSSFNTKSSYVIPVSSSDVTSISFYYDNLGKKKLVTSPSDISLVFDSLDATIFHGEYSRYPTGGQSFILVFHLADGEDWCCTYYQTNFDNGFYQDDTTKLSVSNLDLKKIWSDLSSPEHSAFYGHEFTQPVR